jgi:hypothetical protein
MGKIKRIELDHWEIESNLDLAMLRFGSLSLSPLFYDSIVFTINHLSSLAHLYSDVS